MTLIILIYRRLIGANHKFALNSFDWIAPYTWIAEGKSTPFNNVNNKIEVKTKNLDLSKLLLKEICFISIKLIRILIIITDKGLETNWRSSSQVRLSDHMNI